MEILSETWLRKNVKEDAALDAVKIAFEKLSQAKVTQPPVMQLSFPEHKGETCIKSAHLQGQKLAAVKIASGFYDNAKLGLPTGSGLMLVMDATTGTPKALLLDNGYLTDLRTGAAGALAVDLLSPKRALKKVCIIGSGCQARFQLRAISKVRSWESVHAFSPNRERLQKYCDEMHAEFNLPVVAAESVKDAVRDADVIVTTTPTTAGFVRADWIKSGCTLICMGSDTPGKRELESGVLEMVTKKGKIIVDSKSQCLRLGELQHAPEMPVHGELGDVLTKKVTARESDDEVIVVDLTGCGAQDAAIAEFAFMTHAKAAP